MITIAQERGNHDGERGQVLPLVAICLATIFGFAAFAVDAGFLRYEQRIQQNAADSAAIAGASELVYGGANVTTAAQGDAAKNGFTNDGVNVVVTVSDPPASGAYSGNGNAVDVTIRAKHPSFFAGLFGMSNLWVTTEAVGLLRPSTGPDCVYVLKNTSATTVNGGQINSPNCGIIVNNALTVNGSSIDLASIGAAGQITSNGATYAEATPAPALQVADPCSLIAGCAYLQSNPPATSPCNYTNFTSNGGSSVWLNPGVYCGNTTFNGTTNVNFNPGTYVFTGNITTNGIRNYNGSGVTLIFTGSGNVTFNGSAANLQAPTSGNTAGMLFYAPNAQGATVNGGPGALAGVLYFPKSNVTFNGSSSSYYVLIAGLLTQNGSISDPGPGSGGSYIREGVLVQ